MTSRPCLTSFNSIKVRLELWRPLRPLLVLSRFNSIKVRLELAIDFPRISSSMFQFHKGTIRTLFAVASWKVLCGFNSIKVRLEPCCNPIVIDINDGFNSIKVRLERVNELRPCFGFEFQFHKGTIRTCFPSSFSALLFCFNSIKVRLEHSAASIVDAHLAFQFHKGTIRTFFFGVVKFRSIVFQFHKGTIRTSLPLFNAPFIVVSIP